MTAELSKWVQTLRIAWTKQLTYKVNFILLIIGPTVVFFFIKYNLWSTIFEMENVDFIQGYDFKRMLAYQVWVMIVAFLAQGYNSMNLAEDIRLGRISSYLIYPFDFWKFHTAGFLAFQGLQLFIALVTLVAVIGLGFLPPLDWQAIALGVGYSLLVGFLWFAVSFLLGLVAFWMEETWVLRVMFLTVASFLSGAVLPLEIFPDWLRALLDYSPFPYMTYVPVKIFMGEYEGSVLFASLIPSFWIALTAGLAALVWKRGLRLYTAAGM